MLDLILDVCNHEFSFADYEECRNYFKNMINIIRQMNYSEFESEQFNSYLADLKKLVEENGK